MLLGAEGRVVIYSCLGLRELHRVTSCLKIKELLDLLTSGKDYRLLGADECLRIDDVRAGQSVVILEPLHECTEDNGLTAASTHGYHYCATTLLVCFDDLVERLLLLRSKPHLLELDVVLLYLFERSLSCCLLSVELG